MSLSKVILFVDFCALPPQNALVAFLHVYLFRAIWVIELFEKYTR